MVRERLNSWLKYSVRRRLLDEDLESIKEHLRGRVLEIGNGQTGRRGRFQPPFDNAESILKYSIGVQPAAWWRTMLACITRCRYCCCSVAWMVVQPGLSRSSGLSQPVTWCWRCVRKPAEYQYSMCRGWHLVFNV